MIVSKIIILYYNSSIVPTGVPIVPFTPKTFVNKEEGINKEINKGENKINKKEEKKDKTKDKIIPTVFIPTPIFINQMNKNSTNIYNKFQSRKMRPFAERSGDWICKKCRNLNFAFRIECNRCKLPKKDMLDNHSIRENVNNNEKNGPFLNQYINSNYNSSFKNNIQNKNKFKYKNQIKNNFNDDAILN